MIVGKEMIASGVNHYRSKEKVLIFVSGVSNSKDNLYRF